MAHKPTNHTPAKPAGAGAPHRAKPSPPTLNTMRAGKPKPGGDADYTPIPHGTSKGEHGRTPDN